MLNHNNRDLILFVDDEKICHTLVELIVPNFTKYSLISAFTGTEAIRLSKRYADRIILVLCDIMLSDMNGFEVYHAISGYSKCKNIPFVFQSGYSNQENMLNSYHDVNKKIPILYKPYKQQDLLATINNAIHSKLS